MKPKANPFKIRFQVPKPGSAHKDKNRYTRKEKYKDEIPRDIRYHFER